MPGFAGFLQRKEDWKGFSALRVRKLLEAERPIQDMQLHDCDR